MRTMLIALAAAAALAAGCGGGDDDGGAATGEAAAPADDRPVQYAECMRENGVPEFPDPTGGRIQLRAGPGSSLRPDSPEFKAAQEACQDFAPSGERAGGGQNEQRQAQVLAFAQCMRENGVPEFPDPKFDGGSVRMQLPKGVSAESPEFEAAQQACQEHMSGPGGAP